jgi:hypothetical protein
VAWQQVCAVATQERIAGGAGAKRLRRTSGVTAVRTSTHERARAGTGFGQASGAASGVGATDRSAWRHGSARRC